MARFRDIKTVQKFAAAHASVHNHFNQERHLYNRGCIGVPQRAGDGGLAWPRPAATLDRRTDDLVGDQQTR